MYKRILAALTAAILALSLTACSQQGGSNSDASKTSSNASAVSQQPTKDRAGNAITVPETVNTIVSLAPSVTQVLCELGMADKIVGIDNQSPNYTDQLKADLPQFDMMSVDTETLIALKPDMVFASGISYVGAEDPFKSVRDVGICVADIPSSSSLNDVKLDNQFTRTASAKAPRVKNSTTTCRPPSIRLLPSARPSPISGASCFPSRTPRRCTASVRAPSSTR